ncbi:MAG: hypothetical protein U0L09_01960, partial [Christensenellales bacterium]|nr:hypothetical protein [Christensenellales bacterium]
VAFVTTVANASSETREWITDGSYEEEVEFLTVDETGLLSSTQKVRTNIDIYCKANVKPQSYDYENGKVIQVWQIENCGNVDITSVLIDDCTNTRTGQKGLMQLEYGLKEPLAPGATALFATSAAVSSETREWITDGYYQEEVTFRLQDETGFLGISLKDRTDIGFCCKANIEAEYYRYEDDRIIQVWRLENCGELDITRIVLEGSRDTSNGQEGLMRMEQGLTRPLGPGNTVLFATYVPFNDETREAITQTNYEVTFRLQDDIGLMGITRKAETEFEAPYCDASINPISCEYKDNKVIQVWEIENCGNLDITSLVLEDSRDTTYDHRGLMQLEYGLEKTLAPGKTASFVTYIPFNSETRDWRTQTDYEVTFGLREEIGCLGVSKTVVTEIRAPRCDANITPSSYRYEDNKIIQVWELENRGNADITSVVLEAARNTRTGQKGLMQLEYGLEEPLAPGKTVSLVTSAVINDETRKWITDGRYQEEITFRLQEETGCFGSSLTSRTDIRYECKASIKPVRYEYESDEVIQVWEIKNYGNVDITSVVVKDSTDMRSGQKGMMQLKHNLEEPLAPGKTAFFATCVSFEEETREWRTQTNYGVTFSLREEIGCLSIVQKVQTEIEAPYCDANITPSSYKYEGDRVIQVWQIENCGNVDITSVILEASRDTTCGQEGLMQLEYGLKEPLAPGKTALFATYASFSSATSEEIIRANYEVTFRLLEEIGGLDISRKAETDIEAPQCYAVIEKQNYLLQENKITQIWKVKNFGLVDITSVTLEDTRDISTGGKGLMQTEYKLVVPIAPGETGVIGTSISLNSENREWILSGGYKEEIEFQLWSGTERSGDSLKVTWSK